MAGNFVWYELMTSDPRAAQDFYQHVVGWSAKDAGLANLPYWLFSAEATPVAGLMALPAEASAARPGWLGYVGVDDVDAEVERVKRMGGKVHHAAQDIPGVGRFAVLADPQGAAFALFKASEAGPSPAPMKPGHVGWHELHAADAAQAFEFYSHLFGWQKNEALDMGPAGTYQLFGQSGMSMGGMFTKPPHESFAYWLFYFTVASIHEAVTRVKEKGGKVINGPMQVPGGAFIINGLDPQGAVFALVAPPPKS